jgi:TonB family protein
MLLEALTMRSDVAKSRSFQIGFTSLLLFFGWASQVPGQCLKSGTTHEQILRSRAVRTVLPLFPPEALKDRKGQEVAVALLELNESGDVKTIKIVQANDQFIERAMYDAIKQWKFKPFEIGGQPACVQGKLTFYFVINENGKGVVKNPKIYR